MDATAWVAIAGIAGTLLGSLLGPFIAERMRRRSAHEDRLRTEKVAALSELNRLVIEFRNEVYDVASGTRAPFTYADVDPKASVINHARLFADSDVAAAVDNFLDACIEANGPAPDVERVTETAQCLLKAIHVDIRRY